MRILKFAAPAIGLALGLVLSGQAFAATCQNTGSFERWLADFKNDAAAQGIPPQVIAAAAPHMRFEQRIVAKDRAQGVFNLSFLKFSDRILAGQRYQNGVNQMKAHAALFAKVEREYGVPGSILTAFWGLESDYGNNTGNSNIFAALATLAYDCRRLEFLPGAIDGRAAHRPARRPHRR